VRDGRGEVEGSVRPVRVVMVGEDSQHLFKVFAVEDQKPVEAFAARYGLCPL
jgi:hypothetical protein